LKIGFGEVRVFRIGVGLTVMVVETIEFGGVIMEEWGEVMRNG
jgi:hypothetical protein